VFLIQLLLPVYDNAGRAIPDAEFSAVRRELTERFGGVTAYVRSPATGLWKRDDGQVDRDDVVMVEVMVDALERPWWHEYLHRLEHRFHQDTILARALAVELL
jgi:hypothetical protein